jgi:cohesin loading factor subunit SCC2
LVDQAAETHAGSAKICQNIINILQKSVGNLKKFSPEFVLSIEEDLAQLIHQHNSMSVVRSAISCLCEIISRHSHHFVFLREMQEEYCEFVESLKSMPKSHLPQAKPKLLRSLWVIGLLCRYFDFDMKRSRSEKNRSESLHRRALSIYQEFLCDPSLDIQIKAMQGLGHLFIRTPQFLADCEAILAKILTQTNTLLKVHVIRSFSEFLSNEQRQLSGTLENSAEPVRDHSDVGARAIQAHISLIIPMLFDRTLQTRSDAMTVIGQLLKHGLAHPTSVTEWLIALLSDRTNSIAEMAYRNLSFIHEKSSALVLNRLGAGMKRAYAFQQNVYSNANALVSSKTSQGPESFLNSLYGLFKTKRSTREAFLDSLIRLMEETKDGLFMKFLADSLGFLPFSIQGEPLRIISALDRMISLQAGSSLKSLKSSVQSSKSEKSKFHTFE